MGGSRRTVASIVGAGIGVALLIAGAALAIRQSDDSVAIPDTGEVEPMAAPSGTASPVVSPRILVEASSFLAPAGDVSYEPGNTIDGDPLTAWNSDAQRTDGRGETLTYRFAEPVDLQIIQFRNGYAKSDQVYNANHRLRDLRVITDSGSRIVTLLDTSELQEITHEFGYTSKVVLEVLEVYPGDGFDDSTLTADLALTEITFVAVQR